jgi:hypothetical protein
VNGEHHGLAARDVGCVSTDEAVACHASA